MVSIVLCLLAFATTFWIGRRSLARGLVVLFVVGYVYGIVRANLAEAASHFIFDASLAGLYASQKWSWPRSEGQPSPAVRTWAMALIAWPFVMALLPFQNLWVTLVGLRGNALFLPLILLGCRLKARDLSVIVRGLAFLNLFALGFGVVEYFWGIESFYPRNQMTEIIYMSNDVAGGSFRIPSIFVNAHAYGSTMILSLPFLFGAWAQRTQNSTLRLLYMLGMAAAAAGVLLSATRVNFAALALLLVVATLTPKLSVATRLVWISCLILGAVLVAGNERLQRFTTLADSGVVAERVSWGVNQSFWEIVLRYPFGNGLGGGGTSIPYFLLDQVKDPVLMENEYARIAAEQGLLGLLLWASFIVWHLQNRTAFQKTAWRDGRRLGWFAYTAFFFMALIGTGLLTAIPATGLLLLGLGWISTPVVEEDPALFSNAAFAPMRRAVVQG